MNIDAVCLVYQVHPNMESNDWYIYTFASASTWWRSIGLFPNSTSGFGRLSVKGRNLVPKPPTNIRAFILQS